MISKLNNLANWLEGNGLNVESSLVSDMLPKFESSIPEELQGVFDDKELSSPPRLGGQDLPGSLREVKELFSSDELGETSLEGLKDRILYKREVLKKGPRDESTSQLVKEVQSLLEEYGYILPGHGVDGIFGNETEKAVIEFQKNNKNIGLTESGEIGASTLMVLQSTIATRRPKVRADGDQGGVEDAPSSSLDEFEDSDLDKLLGTPGTHYQDPTRGEGDHKYPGDYSPHKQTDKRHVTGHKGIDLFAPKGTPLYPLGPGKVTRRTTGQKSGNMIIIEDENGVRSSYMHLDSFSDKDVGDYVSMNDVIGYVGDTGNAKGTSPHLHFEVRVGGSLINPKSIFGKSIESHASNDYYREMRTSNLQRIAGSGSDGMSIV